MENQQESEFFNFFKNSHAGSIVLFGAALLAILVASSPLELVYNMLLSVPVEVRVGELEIAKPPLLWVNDGLLAAFFFLVGLGLLLGKQVGVFCFCWLFIKCKVVPMPTGMTTLTLYGTSLLCGIGFAMSLFIGSLAFEETGVNQAFDERLGIIVGSLASGIPGYLVLRFGRQPGTREQ